MGRSLLPPACTLYRIASCRWDGGASAAGKVASIALSMSWRRNWTSSAKSGWVVGVTLDMLNGAVLPFAEWSEPFKGGTFLRDLSKQE